MAGAGFFLTPYGQSIEEEYGLVPLFHLRGPRSEPGRAVIVSVDSDSPDRSAYPSHLNNRSRAVHAELVDRLMEYGAAGIVFDVLFTEKKDMEGDRRLAEAIRRSGKVVLVEGLQRKSLAPPEATGIEGNIEMELLVSPLEEIADAALALSPFPLPKIPVRVTRSWLFKSSCGEIPTLPAVSFQAVTLRQCDQLLALLRRENPHGAADLPADIGEALNGPGLVETMKKIRFLFLQEPSLKDKLLAATDGATSAMQDRQNLHALVNLYAGEGSAAIDFYGPPFTFPTLSYGDVLRGNEDILKETIRGRVVFVGASRKSWSNQKDGFFTVFSQPDGLDISGVELAATVFSNLAENRAVRHVTTVQSLGIIAFFAFAAGLVCFLMLPLPAAGVLLGGIAVSAATGYFLFAANGTWFPLIIPLLFVPLAAYLAATLANYFQERQHHRHVSTALSFYIPGDVVEQLSRDPSSIGRAEKMVYSTCLISDAQHYTTLSERMRPKDLSLHMNEYYRRLFSEVKRKDGIVCNVVGDSMLAHWPSSGPEAPLAEKACRAALHIARAAELFNALHRDRSLPTRIGLHAGLLLLDNIGAEDHFEYAPVGDVVNTVSRIEALNKRIGTRILASNTVLDGTQGVASREVGTFLLGGKTQPVVIFELLADEERTAGRNLLCNEAFPEALLLFRRGRWPRALKAFNHCLVLDTEDGPSRFYKEFCESFLLAPPVDWKGILQVEK